VLFARYVYVVVGIAQHSMGAIGFTDPAGGDRVGGRGREKPPPPAQEWDKR
jgi:hypothetical protein